MDNEMARCTNQPESGGILLGFLRGEDIEVVARTTPGPSDLRSFSSFERSDPRHQDVAREVWIASRETQTWVGEWHTHPYGDVLPSSIDLKTWRMHARREKRPMVFILLAPSAWGVFLAIPYLLRTDVRKLEILEYGTTGRVFSILR
jgi:integrative and conjugative element protein (TIGR02256 family)